MERDGHTHSLWQDTAGPDPRPDVARPSGRWDVLIVGAGITGLTTAMRLVKAGRRCLVAEARNIGFGTTGGTTAHLNTVLDTPYTRIRRSFGEEAARLVAKGLEEAMGLVRDHVQEHTHGCGFRALPAYIFSTDAQQTKELERMMEATRAAGIAMTWGEDPPIPFPYERAVKVPGQAQLHPLRYLHGLADAFRAAGGTLLEGCRVTEVEEGPGGCRVRTDPYGAIEAGHVIYATHVPPGVNILHFRCAPYRSYVLAAKLEGDAYPDALLYDLEDPYHYYRTQTIDGEPFLIAGGEDHKTGHEADTRSRVLALEEHVRALFPVARITHTWSAQYFEPADGLPYIGRLPGHGPRVLVATGYGGNGMILGTLAAIVLEELITQDGGPYAELFDPRRGSPVAGFVNFTKEAADVVGHLLSRPFLGERDREVEALKPGEGKLIRTGSGIIGVHRDDAGMVHAVDAACTHIRCTVKWNTSERSWDCPCHGSRFQPDGRMLTGPARKDLARVRIKGHTDGRAT